MNIVLKVFDPKTEEFSAISEGFEGRFDIQHIEYPNDPLASVFPTPTSDKIIVNLVHESDVDAFYAFVSKKKE